MKAHEALGRLEVSAGEYLITEGDEADFAYIIEDGEVEILVRRNRVEIVFATVGPGEIVGEMALIDSGDRSASARALTDVVCQVIPADVFREELERSPMLIQMVTELLVRHLRRMVAPRVGAQKE